MQLLDYYKSRFGQAVKRQGNGFNGPCLLCGGEPGKSDRFMVWPQRADHLGDACSRNGITGIWSCRQCGASGDTIAYLTRIENMSFKEALGELGIESAKRPVRMRKAPPEPVIQAASAWSPKVSALPSADWQAHAMKLVESGEREIWNNASALQWLRARGIDDEAVRSFRIGYLPEESVKYHGRFRPRKVFGLPPKTGQDGKVHDKLYIPRGILVPTFSPVGEVLNLRIRRHREDLRENAPKYMELEGSYKGPLFLRSSLPRPLAVYFITEAELDAMLIHHVSGGVVGAVAVRTNRGKPDASCHEALKAAARVCVALDYDEAGAEGCDFWEENFANSTRWPTPEGKDPGDAFALGVDIREWIAEALPPSVKLPERKAAIHGGTQVNREIQGAAGNGQLEASASGQNNRGKGRSPELEKHCKEWPSEARARVEMRVLASDWREESSRWRETQPEPRPWATEKDFTPEELALIGQALPKDTPLGMIYLDVAVIWLLWRRLPIAFVQRRDEQGNCVGFRWEYDFAWAAGHEREFDRFWRHQATSRAFWLWLSAHPASRVTSGNLLRLYDLQAQL